MTSSDSERIDASIASLGDWRGDALARMRKLIKEADKGVVEEVKWVKPSNPNGVPTWVHDGIICTGEVYKAYIKLTFMHGAALDDPDGALQRRLRRRHPARHRHPRGRDRRRQGVQGAHQGRRRPQHVEVGRQGVSSRGGVGLRSGFGSGMRKPSPGDHVVAAISSVTSTMFITSSS